MRETDRLEEALEALWDLRSDKLRIATPLGLGKPNRLLNALYAKFRDQASATPKRLEVFTALSLDPPTPGSDLERRFLEPFLDRHFGKDYPRLEFVEDLKKGRVPEHIRIHEFYAQAGAYLGKTMAQRDYVSLNYTHVARALKERGLDALVQLVARHPDDPTRFSLSCNSDLTLDVNDLFTEKPLFKIAVVHPDLPFLGGDAEVGADFFDLVYTPPGPQPELFALPLNSLDPVDHLIGFHASRLVRDGGTLQVGIGSLSDALVASLLWRQRANATYSAAAAEVPPPPVPVHEGTFAEGLYGTSEMMMDGFMHLRQAGILKREICDLDEKRRRYMHAAFFLGSKDFYSWLRTLSGADYEGLSMTRVSKVNDLYDANEWALRRQRKHARFFNTCMKVSLLGGAMSDTLNDGQVVSGIGGQYNFVAMSHELKDAHSVLLLRSVRTHKGRRESNITTDLRHLSIPRHLRDLVVTEYGIANLKGKSDEECIQALIHIADAEFQDELAAWGIANKKLSSQYRVPEAARANTPTQLRSFVEKHRAHFQDEPFGTSFTPVENRLKPALLKLREASPLARLRYVWRGIGAPDFAEEIHRLELASPSGWDERFTQWAVRGALK
ncbi:MAG: acetyl-CoA hydrolase [Bdellovibrionaceae bacterium]|nr:acetyl-CoA hydrolase [Pseudobdellovibrionaceae bacterium]